MCRKITPETQAKKIMFPLFPWQHLATEMVNPRQLSFPTHQQAEAALRSRWSHHLPTFRRFQRPQEPVSGSALSAKISRGWERFLLV
jgi:hypothetical protein